MNGGYIKLYRKATDSDLWADKNAWRVFEWLLLNVDYKTGKGSFGRTQIARATGLKENTVYKVTGRLHEKYQVLNIKSNNKFTEFSVTNWAKYQQDNDSVTGSVHEKEQERPRKVTLYKEERNKNKEYKRESTLEYLLNIPQEQITELSESFNCSENQVKSKGDDLYSYCKAKGKTYKDYQAFLRNAVKKDFGVRKAAQTFTPPELPELTEEQRMANIARLDQMRKQIFKS